MKKHFRYIEILIRAEICKLAEPEGDYYEQQLCADNQEFILAKMKELLGYDYEKDAKTEKFCLKATQDEIWHYYLDHVLPRLKIKLCN